MVPKIEDELKSDPNIIYLKGDDENVDITDGCKSLGELILRQLAIGGNETVLIDGLLGRQITFNEIRDQSLKLARGLFDLGLRKNDVIAIVSENRVEYPGISFAALILGAIVMPINLTYTERELEHAFKLSPPKFVFTSTFAAGRVVKVANKFKSIQNVISIDNKMLAKYVIPIKKLLNKFDEIGSVDEFIAKPVNVYEQVALILCSSGTTGLPKGVEITHANMMVAYQGLSKSRKLIEMVYNEPIKVLTIAPWFHVLGFMGMFLISCSENCKAIFMAQFDSEAFLQCIEKYRANCAMVVPPIMVFLAKTPLLEKYDLSSLKEIGCGAASLSKEVEDQVMDRFNGNVIVRQGYGMSETTYGIIQQIGLKKPGSVGQAMGSVYIKVVDEHGKSLGPNEKGELCFKGPLVMKGYVGDERATKETIDENGWLHSGDIGYYDEDEQFFIVDRIKELIKYKGYQVPPAEIEGLLLSYHKVDDVAVVGIPDEETGEKAVAFIVKKPKTQVTEKEIIEFVAQNASKPKQLHGGVHFINEIPKTVSGKILRRVLRDKAMKLHQKSKL